MPKSREPGSSTGRPASVFDVARAAGVSHQTVSRVLNAHPSVRDTTKQKVLDAMRELSYRPNLAARALASQRTRSIGILTTSVGEFGPSSTVSAITTAARARGYSTIVETAPGSELDDIEAAFGNLADLAVEGIVVVAPQTRVLDSLGGLSGGIPSVAVQSRSDLGGVSVALDQVDGARMATAHLADLGHTRIAHLAGPDDWLDASSRRIGYELEVDARGLAARIHPAESWQPGAGQAAASELFASGATAVFASNDQLALGLLHAAHAAGIDVPGDLSIVGFDDMPEAAHFWPPLTTVRQDFGVAGVRCVELLLGENGASPTVQPTLVVRDSAAGPR